MAIDPIKPLQNEADKYQSALDASSTAYGGDQIARKSDVSNQVGLMSAQQKVSDARDTQLKNRWGLNEERDDSPPKKGVLGTALDYISRPLYGVVGATEAALGKGVAPTMSQNISENMKTGHRTFGDLLKREGVPYGVAAPLGFVLDVTFDPVNWMTAGTTALLPRVAAGLAKGAQKGGVRAGLEAAKTGAQSSLPGVLTSRFIKTVGTKTPYLASTKAGQAMGRATDTAYEAANRYDALTGRDFRGTILPRTGTGISDYRMTIGDLAKHSINSIPFGVGASIWKNMEYSSDNWLRIVRLKDALMKSSGVGRDVEKVLQRATVPEAGAEAAAKISNIPPAGTLDMFDDPSLTNISKSEVDKKFSAALNAIGREDALVPIKEGVQDSMDLLHNPALGATADSEEIMLRLASEVSGKSVLSMEDLQRLVKEGAFGETGMEWYDNMQKGIRELKMSSNANINKIAPAVKGTVDFLDQWMALFRVSKISLSPPAYLNSAIGNTAMYGMAGGSIIDRKWQKSMLGAFGYYMGTKKQELFFREMYDVPQLKQWFDDNPTAWLNATGVPVTAKQKALTTEQLLRIAKDNGSIGLGVKSTDPAIMQEMHELSEIMRLAIAEGNIAGERTRLSVIGKKLKELMPGGPAMGGMDETKRILKEKGESVTRYDLPVGMMSQEYAERPAVRRMLDAVAERAKTGGILAKALDVMLNKSPSLYEKMDQSSRMGTFKHLTMNGWTERELNIARRTAHIGPEDVMDKWNDNGMPRYRMAPDKAMEIVMETYLNYAAMPPFIRMMRNFPILSSPFVSFAYGMSLKTVNTLGTNPAFFNKVTFAMNEFGGQKSPLEKEALEGQYYSYLNSDKMFKLPFFKENPLYINTGSALPYLSLNAFTPGGRAYKEFLPNTLVSFIDKSGFMSNPVGQVAFDYLILPSILSSALEPQGSFGQRLYPKDATMGEKSFYAARQLGESVMPGIASIPLGLGIGATVPGATNYIPSYQARTIANAVQQKDQYGITRKESAASRTMRRMASALGIPVQAPIDLTNVANQKKK